MKFFTTTMIFFLFSTLLYSRAPIMTNPDGRQITSLNGEWKYIIDPLETGFYDYRYKESANGFFQDAKPKDKTERIEYDFDTADQLYVPGDWNTQKPELFFYEGTIWYRQKFSYTPKNGNRVFLYFGAANYESHVYLNGKKLGSHIGGYTPFQFEITDKLEKVNSLILKIDNKRAFEAVPTVNFDWWNYGGLTRDVLIIEEPATFVHDYKVQLAKGSLKEIGGYIQLDGAETKEVTLSIPDAKIAKSFTTDKNGRAEFRFKAKLDLWSPDNPKLYEVMIETDAQTISDRIGFRSIETRGTDILLNGKPIFLAGVCQHEEQPLHGARAYSIEDARTVIRWVKEMNGNFMRLAHYPHREAMAQAADEMGILLWEEIPVYWTIQWDNKATYENAENQLTELIRRDQNHASVILWSVANETPLSEPRLKFLTRLARHAKKLDDTRLVTAALERHYINPTTQMIDDPFGTELDVIGCNEYIGWYDGLPEKCNDIQWECAYDKPVIFSEFGGGAQFGLHGDKLTRWSEEFQEDIYIQQTKMFARIPFLKGTTPWILKDFRSPKRQLPDIQNFYNRKGLISERGEKKKAFYVMQDYYAEIKEYPRRLIYRQNIIFGGINGKLSSDISFDIKASYSSDEDRALFVRNNSRSNGVFDAFANPLLGFQYGNSFDVLYDDIKTLSIFGELEVDVTKRLVMGGNLEYNNYTTTNQVAAWNLPEIQGAVFGKYKNDKWYASANVFFVGERQDLLFSGTFPSTISGVDTLDAFVDVNLNGGYHLNDMISIFLKLNNILNNDYERFANFNVQGFQVLGGITYKFDF